MGAGLVARKPGGFALLAARPLALEPLGALEPRSRQSDERLRKGAAAARHDLPVRQHDEERMRVLRVLLADVTLDVELGIPLQRIARSSATVSAKRSGDCPGSVRPDCATTQTKSIACTTSIAARKTTRPIAIRQYRLLYQCCRFTKQA